MVNMILGGIGFFILLRRNLIGFSASAEYSVQLFFSADLPAMDMADFKMMSATSAL